jgi:SAM-dependent methyltransferase
VAQGLDRVAPDQSVSQNILCPTCGGKTKYLLTGFDRNQRASNDRFRYFRCLGCGTVFLNDVPADLSVYYPNEYYSLPASLEELRQLAEPDRYRIEQVREYVTRGRLLEIGPAYGLLPYLAKEAGFDVDTIEMDERCCRFLEEVVGVKAIRSSRPNQVLKGAGPYDAIVLRHVVEHLTDPWDCLRQTAVALAPGGVLIITVPNPEALQFKLLRSNWWHLDAPRHLQLIPARVYIERLREWGLEQVQVTCNDQGGLQCNESGWIVSVEHAAESAPARLRLRRIAIRTYRALRPMIEPFERRDLRGTAFTLIFQKKEQLR